MFKQYYNPLCNFASTYVRDRKRAQDVVQDVFAKIWDQRDTLEISQNIKGYLFQAVKNRSLEIVRRDKTESDILSEGMAQQQDENIEEQARKFMLKERLYNSIRQLPPKCQEIFILNKIDGLNYREIAESKNISIKTVENHIGKAYRKLRELMSDKLSELQ